MMYFKGKEIRADEMGKRNMLLYTVVLLFGLRVVLSLIFGKKYALCVFGIEMKTVIGAIILWIICSICSGLIYTYLLVNERNIIELFKLGFTVGALSVICFFANSIGIPFKIIKTLFYVCIVPVVLHVIRCYGISKKINRKIRWIKLIRRSFRKAYFIFQVSVFILLALLGEYKLVDRFNDNTSETLNYSNKEYVEVYNENDMASILDANRRKLIPLKKEIYCTLSREERLNSLQVLLDCILDELGCEEEYRLTSEVMPAYKLGYYNERLHVVVVSDSILMSFTNSDEVCSTILHEAYHAYQNEMINRFQSQSNDDSFASSEVARWYWEMYNYVEYNPYAEDSTKSYLDYSEQALESSANRFMNQWSGFIADYINNLDISEM